MCSQKNSNIPGYVWCPKRLRYFKDLPPQVSGFSQDELNSDFPKEKELKTYKSKTKNVPQCLALNQTGYFNGSRFEREIMSLRLRDLRLVENFLFPDDANTYSLEFLKGSENSIYGLWNTIWKRSFRNCFIIGEIIHGLAPTTQVPSIMISVERNGYLNDLCEGRDQCLLSVANLHKPISKGVISLTNRSYTTRHITFNQSTLRCCAGSSVHDKFSIGLDKGVALFRSTERFHLIECNLTSDTVSALQYNDQGNVLYCGNTKGEIIAVDYRHKLISLRKNVVSGKINDLIMLSNSYEIVCSTDSGNLIKIDLRKNEKILEFYGHTPIQDRSRLSISEDHHLLCATGSDYITRLWSLRHGGDPLKCVIPDDFSCRHQAWLVSNSLECLMYVAHKNKIQVYEYGSD